jgi:hypothetical protein
VTEAKITPDQIRAFKAGGRKIAALTAYDYPMARMLDEAGIPMLLVGDSLGMVVLGYPDTTHVTMDEMEHHVRAVVRARPKALIAADLPYRSYENASDGPGERPAVGGGGCGSGEGRGRSGDSSPGGGDRGDGIPFVGHLGMLPQHVLEEGGYRIKGRDAQQRAALLESAKALEVQVPSPLSWSWSPRWWRRKFPRVNSDSDDWHWVGSAMRRSNSGDAGPGRDLSLVHPRICSSKSGWGGLDPGGGAGLDDHDRRMSRDEVGAGLEHEKRRRTVGTARRR